MKAVRPPKLRLGANRKTGKLLVSLTTADYRNMLMPKLYTKLKTLDWHHHITYRKRMHQPYTRLG